MTSRFVKKYDAAFFVVVFPEIKAYLPQFVSSLVSQTAHDFDLCIFNDGLDKDILARQFEPINGIVHCNISDIAGTPASIRIDALNVLIEHGYRYAILGDSDDFFSRNRVEKSLELLKHYDVVVNDLNITDQAAHPALLNDGKIILPWVDRFQSRSIKVRVANNLYSDFKHSSEITIFEQTSLDNIKDNKLGELLADMGVWNFGLPYADVLSSGKILVFYYAGNNKQMNLYWSRLTF